MTPIKPKYDELEERKKDKTPPYPSTLLIRTARLPKTPKIKEEQSKLERANMLVRAYAGAVESRYGQKCWVYAKGVTKESEHYRLLVEAAEELFDFDIAPAAWCAFSCDVWKHYGDGKRKSKKGPPLKWVFSIDRIQKRHGWFNSENDSYDGGKLLISKIHLDLLSRYQGLKVEVDRAIMRGKITVDEAWLDKVQEKHFPGGWWKWYAKAREEAVDARARLERLVAEGRFVW